MDKIVVYGLGSAGKKIISQLLKSKLKIPAIIDNSYKGSSYKNIPVITIDKLNLLKNKKEINCLLAFHNHYLDIKKIAHDLKKYNFKKVYTLVNVKKLFSKANPTIGYWLDLDFKLNYNEFKNTINLFQENKSKILLNQIYKYRKYGNIHDIPIPSTDDEYIPKDLPKYKMPLRIVDCGAFNGCTINKIKSSYDDIQSILAFEPDIDNYKKLVKVKLNKTKLTFLPLGLWSEPTTLNFENNSDMSSKISINGKNIISLIKYDDAFSSYIPNLIKMDIEGAEYNALLGMKNTIFKHKPNLCISVYHKPDDIIKIPKLIKSWDLKYKFYLRVHEYNTFGVVIYCLQDEKIIK